MLTRTTRVYCGQPVYEYAGCFVSKYGTDWYVEQAFSPGSWIKTGVDTYLDSLVVALSPPMQQIVFGTGPSAPDKPKVGQRVKCVQASPPYEVSRGTVVAVTADDMPVQWDRGSRIFQANPNPVNHPLSLWWDQIFPVDSDTPAVATATSKSCACGYPNEYSHPGNPWKCSGCRLWARIA